MKHISHNPTRDWYLILGVASALAIVVFVWAYRFHSTVSRPDPIDGDIGAISTNNTLDGKVLEKTDRQFLERSAEYDRIRLNAPRAVDPAE